MLLGYAIVETSAQTEHIVIMYTSLLVALPSWIPSLLAAGSFDLYNRLMDQESCRIGANSEKVIVEEREALRCILMDDGKFVEVLFLT